LSGDNGTPNASEEKRAALKKVAVVVSILRWIRWL